MELGRWRPVLGVPRTFFGLVASEFEMLDRKYANSLPDLRDSKTILFGADYSGEDGKAPYAVYSLLMTSIEAWASWEPNRLQIRRDNFSDSRRMSFKKLSDKQRAQALLPILTAADSLNGLVFSLAINKKCLPVFATSPPLDLGNPQFAAYRKWKPSVLDKAFLVLHLSGLLLAGLGEAGQDLLWFTDEDPIAANERPARHRAYAAIRLDHQFLPHFRYGTLPLWHEPLRQWHIANRRLFGNTGLGGRCFIGATCSQL